MESENTENGDTKKIKPSSDEDETKIADSPRPLWLTIVQIVTAVVFPNIGGMFGAIFSIDDISGWYTELEKPSWTPPNWLFAPMWVILYCLMGLASFLVWKYGGGLKGPAKWCLLLYLVNIILNWMWTPIFFNGKNITGGFVVIILVLATAVLEAGAFGFVYWVAGLMIVPYIIWLTIATSLNGWIYVHN